MNLQPGILTFDSTKARKTKSTRSILEILLFVFFDLGSMCNSTWRVPETEASHASLSVVVDCFTTEIHHSREIGPPTQPQREVRRPPAQSRPSAAPQENTRPSQTQFFNPLCLATQVATWVRCGTLWRNHNLSTSRRQEKRIPQRLRIVLNAPRL